jgi:predicted pyridoxine 5'-phosphate oxidase superfamily flavin-nucleotide-binding protein
MGGIEKAVALAARVGTVFVATADADGLPHVASAGRVATSPGGKVVLADWFCPGTVHNLGRNPRISIVIWDAARDEGFQLLGEVEAVKELGMLNGYRPGEGESPSPPQVERELTVRVDRILVFTHAPHSDEEE